MAVQRLDHVNIRCARLAESIEFYGRVLGMAVQPPPMAGDMTRGAYVCDEAGKAIIHLVATDSVIEAPEPVRGAAQRGMIDHFALRCEGDPSLLTARLAQYSVEYSEHDVPLIDAYLVFARDPNGVMVELSFERKNSPTIEFGHESMR